MDGVRINSPHYLCKLTLKEPGNYTFTFVIAQYEKLNTIHYTLRAYSASSFSLRKLGWLPTQHSVRGERGEERCAKGWSSGRPSSEICHLASRQVVYGARDTFSTISINHWIRLRYSHMP